MGIDILFIIMAAYGFYFGYVYGLIKVVIFLTALLGALIISMYATPNTTQLFQTVLELDSALLPFVAFITTLVGVMLVARIMYKLVEENINNRQVTQATQAVGGFMMAGIFIFLFSVLVTFFSAAHVIRPEIARNNSAFYKYIEKIPVHGTDMLKAVMPYMDGFVDYMTVAMERLETGQKIEPVNHLEDLNKVYETEEDSTFMSQDSLNMNDSLNLPKEDSSKILEDTLPNIEIKVKNKK